jgi:hypothetical protein
LYISLDITHIHAAATQLTYQWDRSILIGQMVRAGRVELPLPKETRFCVPTTAFAAATPTMPELRLWSGLSHHHAPSLGVRWVPSSLYTFPMQSRETAPREHQAWLGISNGITRQPSPNLTPATVGFPRRRPIFESGASTNSATPANRGVS